MLRSLMIICLFLYSCTSITPKKSDEPLLVEGHPAWILQGNVYEVNIRQYTPEGTFRAFESHLERLKKMGVQTLWFMPIHPISNTNRKGKLGSYYAVSSYREINPEFGNLDDWKHLVNRAKAMGFKVVMDMVPNHSGADHEWLHTHPEFYVRDSVTGKPLAPFDWSDVRELNYDNPLLRDSIKEVFRYWLRETPIDGFRVDVAWGVPDDFWLSTLAELRTMKPDLFLLAEAEGPNFHRDGFDASYPWKLFHLMNNIAAGERNVLSLDSLLQDQDTLYPKNALHLYFTSNHDENSWNKADYGTMPGRIHAPFAVFTQTYAQSIPLIYSGQEEPVVKGIRFFYKDTIPFLQLGREKFYQTLLQLRQHNPSLSALAPLTRIQAGDPKAIFSFTRNAGENSVLVILNLSPSQQTLSLPPDLGGRKAMAIFQNQETTLPSGTFVLDPWGYQVFTFSTTP